ncbi:MAG: hypothetical protein KDE33_28380 [Bacteroidetes bacterium]|nr:hypothetical protein [Bacteroidota bacterium]
MTYEFLSKKEKIETEIVIEKRGMKTPDFKIKLNESNFIYSDLKTLHFVGGNSNYTDVQEQSANSKIKLDETIKRDKQKGRKKVVYFGDSVVTSPFKKGSNENHYNINVIIEHLISKAKNNYKSEQVNYQNINGIYLIDVTNLLIPCELEQGTPITTGKLYKELNSRILWNVAFGEIGDPTFNWIEFEGKPNVGERLKMHGLLKEQSLNNLRALAFIVENTNKKNILGFHRMNEDDNNLLEILYEICDFVNDEKNSKYYELKTQ